MSRFSFDSNYDDEDEERDQEREESLADELFLKDQIITAQQENNDILKMEVEQKLIEISIAVCQKNWFWSFKSLASKIRAVRKVFKQFKNMLLNEKF
jgi:hypothetical protein